MSQNAEHLSWSFEEVDAKLEGIMRGIYHACDNAATEYCYEGNYMVGANIAGIYHACDNAATEYCYEGNYMVGANIAGFIKVADAMMDQGIV